MVGIIPGGISGESKVVQRTCSRKGAREREREDGALLALECEMVDD